MAKKKKSSARTFFSCDENKILTELGSEELTQALQKMLLIRNFETRAEAAYQQGKIGGFFHSYVGQEAIQVAAYDVFGPKNWWITTYRCHAMALLLGATPKEIMAELYGRKTGNAKGRGGSMHLYTDRMLGGFAIVGGHIPVAVGASFALKYQDISDELAICFLGDGAMPQGAFHEAMNLASLWDLPTIFVIENNQWGMGTAVERALSFQRLAEDVAPTYNMKGYTIDGMDYANCVAGFKHIREETLKTGRPVLVEAVAERFKGHSVSDPGLYRTKEELEKAKKKDPILKLRHEMEELKFLDDETFKKLDKKQRDVVVQAMEYADAAPWPDPVTLEEGVFAD